MRRSDLCIGKNKGEDQLRSTYAVDQCLCFRYMDSKIPLLPKFQCRLRVSSRSVSDLVGNPEDRFSFDVEL